MKTVMPSIDTIRSPGLVHWPTNNSKVRVVAVVGIVNDWFRFCVLGVLNPPN